MSYKGDERMKEYDFGKVKGSVSSPLLLLTSEERAQWYRDETEKGNPILLELAAAINACYDNKKAEAK